MVVIRNNPELSLAFRNKQLREFFLQYLTELERNPYVLKKFLIDGAEKSYEEQLHQLGKSFQMISKKRNDDGYEEVVRCLDGIVFKVGDMVIDEVQRKHDGTIKKYKISRLYEDDRGLHVRLDADENGGITWRDLSKVNHE